MAIKFQSDEALVAALWEVMPSITSTPAECVASMVDFAVQLLLRAGAHDEDVRQIISGLTESVLVLEAKSEKLDNFVEFQKPSLEVH